MFSYIFVSNLQVDTISLKNKDCPATLSVRIKKNTKYIRYQDKYAKEGLLGVILIDFHHSHHINEAEAWNWLKRSNETKEIFINYFKSGNYPFVCYIKYQKVMFI